MSVAEIRPTTQRQTGTRVTPGYHPREEEVSAVPTYTPKAGDTTHSWYVIDATDVVLGRLAVEAAKLLRGKHKPTFTPNVDGGDFVIVINAEKIAVSGDKLKNKMAYRHSGFPGGLRARSLGDELEKHADRVVEKAIVGMLPHNKLSRQVQKKLKVYVGPEHPHSAQQPVPYEIKQVAQ
jgi:large subunit ribosomal protein L13